MIPSQLSRDEVRDVDRRAIEEYGLPGIVLMENAGRGAADWLWELGVLGPVVICTGRGNNGGDGFVIARHLENRGAAVRVLHFGNPVELRGDAATNYRVIAAAETPCRSLAQPLSADELTAELASAEWIVDALLGTGTQGRLREPYPAVIAAINQAGAAGARVFAVDLPSGLDCDAGQPLGECVRAHCTATFVARKQGFNAPGAAIFTGEVRVIDIGVPHRMFAG